MFDITMGKGFHITFDNGYTVSVQWGRGNYCDHHMTAIPSDPLNYLEYPGASATAETAVIDPTGNLIDHLDGDSVFGWQTPAQVLALMTSVAAWPAYSEPAVAIEATTLKITDLPDSDITAFLPYLNSDPE